MRSAAISGFALLEMERLSFQTSVPALHDLRIKQRINCCSYRRVHFLYETKTVNRTKEVGFAQNLYTKEHGSSALLQSSHECVDPKMEPYEIMSSEGGKKGCSPA